MHRILSLVLTSALLTATMAQPVLANDRHEHREHEFHRYDMDHWRGGRWFNGFHEGRNGWWWTVDDSWYFYPAPVYPYPDPYTPPTIAVAPGTAVVEQPAYAYYCNHPAGYYPYVAVCRHWHRVATAPAPTTVIVQESPQQPQTSPAALAQRHQDYGQLNAYAAELQNIYPTDPRAFAKLKMLDRKVDAFRESLYKRDYNAMDILQSSEDLQHRIDEQHERLAPHRAEQAPPAAYAPPPEPGNLPPGTAVAFPPQ